MIDSSSKDWQGMQTAHSVRGDIKISSDNKLRECDLSQLSTLSVGRDKDKVSFNTFEDL